MHGMNNTNDLGQCR